MKQIARTISVYSADSFGVCSALFELGGLVVMHDPSGCNSTYTTHDEPRWYDQDSLIYISGLEEKDAILGNDDKFIADVIEAARKLQPAFIALVKTPIPYMIGTDFTGLAKVIEHHTEIPTFAFDTNSMHSYIAGASQAFAALARKFVKPTIKRGLKGIPINVIGLTPLDFSTNHTKDSLVSFLEANGYDVVSTWSMGSSLAEIAESSVGSVNLVVSYDGLAAAKYLQEQFDIPYVMGVPIGLPMQNAILQDLVMAHISNNSYIAFAIRPFMGEARITLIGESVFMESLAYTISMKTNMATKVICPLETSQELLDFHDVIAPYEADIATLLHDTDVVIADPLYKPIIPSQATFIPLPHIAFSGRCFEKDVPDLVGDVTPLLKAVQYAGKRDEKNGLE